VSGDFRFGDAPRLPSRHVQDESPMSGLSFLETLLMENLLCNLGVVFGGG
jgi:hypothetical protein